MTLLSSQDTTLTLMTKIEIPCMNLLLGLMQQAIIILLKHYQTLKY
nr:MAG TPA: hypothetical protein [Caudoviricetes sp.]